MLVGDSKECVDWEEIVGSFEGSWRFFTDKIILAVCYLFLLDLSLFGTFEQLQAYGCRTDVRQWSWRNAHTSLG